MSYTANCLGVSAETLLVENFVGSYPLPSKFTLYRWA
jgi:hypothetical protein